MADDEHDCVLRIEEPRGRFVATRPISLPSTERVDVLDKAALEANAREVALSTLFEMGLPGDQIGNVTARLVVYEASNEPGVKYAYGVLTWIQREYGGVPVVGHRAVFTFDLDGTMRRVSATWPALAAGESSWSLPTSGSCALASRSEWIETEIAPIAPIAPGDVRTEVLLMPGVPEEQADGRFATPVELLLAAETSIAGPGGSHKRAIRLCNSAGG